MMQIGENQLGHKTMRKLKSTKKDAIAVSNDLWQLLPNGFAKDMAQHQCSTSAVSILVGGIGIVGLQHGLAMLEQNLLTQ